MNDKTYSIKLTATAQGVDQTFRKVGDAAKSARSDVTEMGAAASAAGFKLNKMASALQTAFSGANTKGAAAAIGQIGAAAGSAASGMGELGKAADQTFRKVGDAAKSAGSGVTGMGAAASAAGFKLNKMASALQTAFSGANTKGAGQAIGQIGSASATAARGVNQLGSAAGKSRDEVSRLSATITREMIGAAQRLTASIDKATAALGRFDKESGSSGNVRRRREELDKFGLSLKNLIRYASGLTAGTLGVHAITGFVGALVDTQKQIDGMRTGLAFALDAGPAKLGAEFDYVRELADRLGQSLPVLAKGYTMIAASAKGTNLQGKATRDIFEAMAAAGTVFSLSADDMTGALLAVRQMMSKGVVNAEELRGQLGERLPGAYEIAARSMGKTTAEFGKMLEAGEVMASDFLPRFAAQLREELGGATESAATKMQASTNRMASAWFRFKVAIDESGVGEAIKRSIDIGTDALNAFSDGVNAARENNAGFMRQMQAGLASKYINDLNSISKAVGGSALFAPKASADKARRAQADQQAAQIEDMRMQAAELARAGKTVSTAYQELQQRLSGNKAGFFGDLKTLHAEYQKGTIDLAKYRAEVQRLIASDTAIGRAQSKAPKRDRGASQALAALKAEIDARVKLTEDGARRERDALAARFQDGEIGAAEYYARDVELQRQAIDAKLAELQRERAATAAGSADRFRVEVQIAIAQRDRTQVAVDGARAASKAEAGYRDSLEQTRLKLAEIQGTASFEQRRNAARSRQATELAQMPAENRDAALQLIDTTAAQEQLRAYEQEASAVFERIRLVELRISQDREAGRLTEAEGDRQLNAARAEQIPVLEEIGARMVALQAAAAGAFGPQQINAVQQFKQELAGLKDAANAGLSALKSGTTQGITNLLSDLTKGTKTASQAFKDFGGAIFDTINGIVSKRLGEQLAKSLFGALEGAGAGGAATSGGAGGAVGGVFASLLKGLVGFADGGLITGPGTGTSDSVLMRGSHGEYMVRAAAVRQVGVGFLDFINSLGSGRPFASRMLGGVPAFAGGGMVTAPPMQAGAAGGQALTMNVYAQDAKSFMKSQSQIAAQTSRLLARASARNN